MSKKIVLGLVAGLSLATPALADGGLGFQPPPFIGESYLEQPARPTPYSAVCLAPPAACAVTYMYPIRAGKPCWCRSGLFVYSGGVTQPPHPRGAVYKY